MKAVFVYIPLLLTSSIIARATAGNASKFDATVYDMTRVMGNVFSTVREKHYNLDQKDPRDPFTTALRGFMRTLDSHSDFMDAKAYQSIMETTQGSFFGIGVIIDNMKEPDLEYLKVIDAQPGGPADVAGIKADDKIVEVEGKTVRGLTVEECRNLIKGKRNTQVEIKILREGQTEVLTFKITRDIVNEHNASCYYFSDNNIYYLSLNMFTENSIKQIQDLLQRCKERQSKGLILDLRNNTGGLLNAGIDIASLFLDNGSLIVTTKNRDQKVIDSYKTQREPLDLPEIPIFILVNNYTASAAEILAGALRAYSNQGNQKKNNLKVFIAGTNTFGKGSVQEVIPMSNDCAIRITVGLYYLPDDYCVQQKGILPDFIIPHRILPPKDVKWFTEQFGQEKSLKNSIAVGKKEDKKQPAKEPEKSWHERREEAIGTDHQILSTARLIDMYAMLAQAEPDIIKKSRESIVQRLQKEYIASERIKMEEITI